MRGFLLFQLFHCLLRPLRYRMYLENWHTTKSCLMWNMFLLSNSPIIPLESLYDKHSTSRFYPMNEIRSTFDSFILHSILPLSTFRNDLFVPYKSRCLILQHCSLSILAIRLTLSINIFSQFHYGYYSTWMLWSCWPDDVFRDIIGLPVEYIRYTLMDLSPGLPLLWGVNILHRNTKFVQQFSPL